MEEGRQIPSAESICSLVSLANSILDYVNQSGAERSAFERWIVLESTVSTRANDSKAKWQNLLYSYSPTRGQDVSEPDVDQFAMFISLTEGGGGLHIYPKLVKFHSLINKIQGGCNV